MFREGSKVSLLRFVGVPLLLVTLLVCLTAASLEQPQVAVYSYHGDVVVFWDPSETFSDEAIILNNVYETLLRYDAFTDKFEPVLAESYPEVSENGLTWTFHLRRGVKFHTGGEMDAEAVKFSIERTISKGMGSSYVWYPVDRIEVADKYTVVFHLKYPAPLDLVAASGYGSHIFDPDFADHEWFLQCHDSGTGPYAVESCEGSKLVVVKKFDDYWRGWEGKHFDKVVFKTVSESSTHRFMLEAGDADVSDQLPVTVIEALRGNPEIEIVHTPSFQNLLALFNTVKSEEYPTSNPLVRRALAYTIPYDDIVEGVLGGYGGQSRGIVPRSLWGYSDSVKQYTFSLETAKALLKEAGYPNGGFELLLTYVSGDEYERRVAELWKAELTKLNIDLEIRGMPWTSQIDLGHALDPNERQDIFIFYWWCDIVHPDPYVRLFETIEPPVFTFSYYSNPLYDELISKALELSATNREESISLYAEIQNILMNDAPGVAIYDLDYLRAKRTSLKGYVDNPAYPHVVFWYDCYRE